MARGKQPLWAGQKGDWSSALGARPPTRSRGLCVWCFGVKSLVVLLRNTAGPLLRTECAAGRCQLLR